MPEFCLQFSRKDFEYDVYALIRAFYPACRITIWYEGGQKPEGSFDADLTVRYRDRSVSFAYEKETAGEDPQEDLPEGFFVLSAVVSSWEDRPEAKNQVKRLVYRCLQKLTGKELPWGDLTGIRPTKIAMGLLEEGRTREEIIHFMQERYFTGEDKAGLAVSVAARERKILQEICPEKGYSLYVGIPFCPTICLYCSFGSHPLERWGYLAGSYLEALQKELEFIAGEMKGWHLDTIYIGGGTPTSLEAGQLQTLLEGIRMNFNLENVREFTVEAGRPDTITEEKLEVLKKFPVTRISINPQTMNQKTLDLIGRQHTVEEVREKFLLARKMGFSNINMDLIVGLPGEGAEEVAHTLEEIRKLGPDSLTVHSLALKRATRLNLFKDEYAEVSFENSQEIMESTRKCASEMGMNPYYLYRQKDIAGNFENVGYAKPGKEGLYNILIMEEKQTIMAAGSGASTKFVFDGGRRIERAENVKDLKSYIERLPQMLDRKREGIRKYLLEKEK